MHGNLWEFCGDWYRPDSYQATRQVDPTGPPSGLGRVLRGGAAVSAASYCRSAFRNLQTTDLRKTTQGFRVVMTIEIEERPSEK